MLAEDRPSNSITQFVELIEAELAEYLSGSLKNYASLRPAIEYAVMSPGKRLRPLLVLTLATDCRFDVGAFLKPALALELLHASSLIHDDLPALDNDDFRRGRPSCHKKFGEAKAILAGDFLISHAFSCIAESNLNADAKSLCVQRLAQAYSSVCEGQSRDIDIDDKDVVEIHRLKTAPLFEAAAVFGCVLSNHDQAQTLASDFGHELGLYFQAYNDLLDLTGTEEQRGRPGSSDERNQKATIISTGDHVSALRRLRTLEGRVLDRLESLQILSPMSKNGMPLTAEYTGLIQSKIAEL